MRAAALFAIFMLAGCDQLPGRYQIVAGQEPGSIYRLDTGSGEIVRCRALAQEVFCIDGKPARK